MDYEQRALAQRQTAIGAGGQLPIMRHQHHRRTALARQLAQQRRDLRGRDFIEIAGGLIGQQQRRFMDQGARQRHALLFTPGEHIHGRMQPIAQAHALAASRGCAPRLRRAHAVQRQHQAHVLLHIQRGQQIEELVDEADLAAPEQRALRLAQGAQVLSVKDHPSGVGPIDAADEIEQGGFAGAAAADDDGLAGRGEC